MLTPKPPAPMLDNPLSDKFYHLVAFAALIFPTAVLYARSLVWILPLAALFGVAIELICDTIHLCPDMIRLAFKVKPVDKILLITDAMEATGLPDGDYSVVVKVRGADVEEQALPVTMTGGQPDLEPAFTFSMAAGTVTGTLVFADGSSHCLPAPAMREWLTSEGFAFDHHHTSLDGKRFEFWANPTDSRAMLIEFPSTGEACVADEGFLYRGGRFDNDRPLAG
jgi:hypothetical protein